MAQPASFYQRIRSFAAHKLAPIGLALSGFFVSSSALAQAQPDTATIAPTNTEVAVSAAVMPKPPVAPEAPAEAVEPTGPTEPAEPVEPREPKLISAEDILPVAESDFTINKYAGGVTHINGERFHISINAQNNVTHAWAVLPQPVGTVGLSQLEYSFGDNTVKVVGRVNNDPYQGIDVDDPVAEQARRDFVNQQSMATFYHYLEVPLRKLGAFMPNIAPHNIFEYQSYAQSPAPIANPPAPPPPPAAAAPAAPQFATRECDSTNCNGTVHIVTSGSKYVERLQLVGAERKLGMAILKTPEGKTAAAYIEEIGGQTRLVLVTPKNLTAEQVADLRTNGLGEYLRVYRQLTEKKARVDIVSQHLDNRTESEPQSTIQRIAKALGCDDEKPVAHKKKKGVKAVASTVYEIVKKWVRVYPQCDPFDNGTLKEIKVRVPKEIKVRVPKRAPAPAAVVTPATSATARGGVSGATASVAAPAPATAASAAAARPAASAASKPNAAAVPQKAAASQPTSAASQAISTLRQALSAPPAASTAAPTAAPRAPVAASKPAAAPAPKASGPASAASGAQGLRLAPQQQRWMGTRASLDLSRIDTAALSQRHASLFMKAQASLTDRSKMLTDKELDLMHAYSLEVKRRQHVAAQRAVQALNAA